MRFKGSGVFKLKELTSNICKYGFNKSWTLDGEGNFSEFDDGGTTQTRTVNEANEITGLSGSWIDPAYDAAGNMISGPKSGDETTRIHYVYDAWNRLVAAKADNSGSPGNTIAAYEYDGTNRRVEKFFADDSGVEYFYNRQWQVLDEWSFDDQGETTAVNQYIWSPRYIDAPIVRFHDGNADGYVYTTGVDNTRYYTGDANYNITTTITIDPNTTETVQHYAYSSYGEATVYDDDWDVIGAPAEDGPLYCGYLFDAETANDYARNRYYSVALAAWFTRDPIAADLNLYRYVGNNPLVYEDPFGLAPPREPGWISDYWYVYGPKIVESGTPGTVCLLINVHYVTNWFTTPYGEAYDKIVYSKTICVPKGCEEGATVRLIDMAASLGDELDALSYLQALVHAEATLIAVETALVCKLITGDYTHGCPSEEPGYGLKPGTYRPPQSDNPLGTPTVEPPTDGGTYPLQQFPTKPIPSSPLKKSLNGT